MNIDELALKLAGIHTERTMFAVTDQEICNFARALIAEYEAAGSEPVAMFYTNPENGRITQTFHPDSFPLYARPDPRVAELEAEVARLKREDFSHERVQNDSYKLANRVLAEQNAALLVAIEQMTQHIKAFRNDPALGRLHKLRASEGCRLLAVAMDIGIDGLSAELLEARDRKRDVQVFHKAAKECDEDSLVIEALIRIADCRESGAWVPELKGE